MLAFQFDFLSGRLNILSGILSLMLAFTVWLPCCQVVFLSDSILVWFGMAWKDLTWFKVHFKLNPRVDEQVVKRGN